jgi:hypothetical protein
VPERVEVVAVSDIARDLMVVEDLHSQHREEHHEDDEEQRDVQRVHEGVQHRCSEPADTQQTRSGVNRE